MTTVSEEKIRRMFEEGKISREQLDELLSSLPRIIETPSEASPEVAKGKPWYVWVCVLFFCFAAFEHLVAAFSRHPAYILSTIVEVVLIYGLLKRSRVAYIITLFIACLQLLALIVMLPTSDKFIIPLILQAPFAGILIYAGRYYFPGVVLIDLNVLGRDKYPLATGRFLAAAICGALMMLFAFGFTVYFKKVYAEMGKELSSGARYLVRLNDGLGHLLYMPLLFWIGCSILIGSFLDYCKKTAARPQYTEILPTLKVFIYISLIAEAFLFYLFIQLIHVSLPF